jgi:extracellular factor (EF) 3-hydroxypalmitic acid methyl ester biosynthesis protein
LRLRRDPRYLTDLREPKKTVQFHDFQGVERTCPVRDFSRTGLSFLLEDGSLIFRIGDILEIRFFSYEKEVHFGAATIVHIQDDCLDGKVISRIGCHFENPMDISTIIRGDKVKQLRNEYTDFIQSLAVEDNLNEEFVHLTSHLHFLLSNFRKKIKEEEEKISREDERIRSELIETLRTMTFEAINEVTLKYCDQFSRITAGFSDSKEHFIHREYFQKTLNEFFLASKLFNRAYTKPLGYAGDYEMMNIIYRNDFEGDDVFSQVMSKVDCEGSAALAVRNRREYLLGKILSVYNGLEEGHTGKVVSVACGPCMELGDLLKHTAEAKRPVRLDVVAMDQDPHALAYAGQMLSSPAVNDTGVHIELVQDNIKNLIIGRKKEASRYANADLIYSAGLCDYLSANATSRLIGELYRYLKPGGCLVIGNFGPYNPQRFKMEYGAEWFLIHRSEEELKDLARGLPEDVVLRMEKEPEGVNLFLNIIKPR